MASLMVYLCGFICLGIGLLEGYGISIIAGAAMLLSHTLYLVFRFLLKED